MTPQQIIDAFYAEIDIEEHGITKARERFGKEYDPSWRVGMLCGLNRAAQIVNVMTYQPSAESVIASLEAGPTRDAALKELSDAIMARLEAAIGLLPDRSEQAEHCRDAAEMFRQFRRMVGVRA